MYIDVNNTISVNKRLIKLIGLEPAIYWAELVDILRHVVSKKTYDEQGFFKLDRNYVERETCLSIEVQLNCDKVLSDYGILMADPDNPDKLSIDVRKMTRIIEGDGEFAELTKVATPLKTAQQTAISKQEAKARGMKLTLAKAIEETDPDLKLAYETWVGSLIDSKNCKLTRAVIKLFIENVRKYTTDKQIQLKIIEIATINSYKDANWAISRLDNRNYSNFVKPSASHLPTQKVGTSVSDDVNF